MAKRRTHAQIIAETTESVRRNMISELCRILRFHCEMPDAADALWDVMQEPGPKRQTRRSHLEIISMQSRPSA